MSDLSRTAALLAVLSTPDRLRLLASVVGRQEQARDCSLPAVAAEVRMTPKAAAKEAVRLAECGLLSFDGHVVQADLSPLKKAADEMVADLPVTALLAQDPELAKFFKGGRLTLFPEDYQLQQRLARVLVGLLPSDRTLSEPAVNQILSQVHDDHATLRRLLVDYGVVVRGASSDYRRVTADNQP